VKTSNPTKEELSMDTVAEDGNYEILLLSFQGKFRQFQIQFNEFNENLKRSPLRILCEFFSYTTGIAIGRYEQILSFPKNFGVKQLGL
jgi:hypothetical protein